MSLSKSPASPDVWDRVSARYDRQLWLERASVRCLLDLAAPRPDMKLLDVATGTGAVLRALATRPARPREVIGVDRSRAMLARVPRLPEGWRTEQADVRALPFPDSSFDLATAAYLLQLLDDTDRGTVLRELRRVLRPDGLIAVLTPAIPAGGPLRPIARALDRLAAQRPDRFGGLRALDPRESLSQAGFEILTTRYSARGYIVACTLARPRHATGW